MCYLCYDIYKRLDVLVFSNKEEKPKALSTASSQYWLARDVEEPTNV